MGGARQDGLWEGEPWEGGPWEGGPWEGGPWEGGAGWPESGVSGGGGPTRRAPPAARVHGSCPGSAGEEGRRQGGSQHHGDGATHGGGGHPVGGEFEGRANGPRKRCEPGNREAETEPGREEDAGRRYRKDDQVGG